MAEQMRHGDIEASATLAQLGEEVRRTQRPLHLHLDDVFISVVPDERVFGRKARQRKAIARTATVAEKYTSVASLAGAAGALPTPYAWDEMRELARDERLAAKFGPADL